MSAPAVAGAAVDVAVAVVRDDAGRVLLAERTPRQVSAGFWELPGGKIDPGETAAEAARRELLEEVGLEARQMLPWRVHEHAFPTKRVRLHLFRVTRWAGQAHGREGQRVAWVDPGEPGLAPLLPSNRRPLTLLALPQDLHVATVGGTALPPQALPHEWRRLAAAGVRWLLLRAPAMVPAQRRLLAQRLREDCLRSGVRAPRVLLQAPAADVAAARCAGLHSAPGPADALPTRPGGVGVWSLAAATPAQQAAAMASEADLVLAGPEAPGAAWGPREGPALYRGPGADPEPGWAVYRRDDGAAAASGRRQ